MAAGRPSLGCAHLLMYKWLLVHRYIFTAGILLLTVELKGRKVGFTSHPTKVQVNEALKTSIRLVCDNCDGHQPGYILQLVEEHGPNADLKETLDTVPCLWCKSVGGLQIALPGT
jgi:hypothetical protein